MNLISDEKRGRLAVQVSPECFTDTTDADGHREHLRRAAAARYA